MKTIGRTFIKGLIAIIPVTLTLYLLFWLADTAELALGNIFKLFFPDNWYIKGFGFVLGLVVVFFVGGFLESRAFLARFNKFEALVIQVPFIRTVYIATRDFMSLFSGGQKGKFKQVVLVEMLPGGGRQIGFITASEFEDILPTFIADDQVAVFLPFSYQMGGITVIMSRENVVEIEMTVEDALRFVTTAGVIGNANADQR